VSAKDAFHTVVKTALQKVQAGTLELYINLGAKKVIAAEKQGQNNSC
jgi:hypothetical protein